MKNFFKLQSSFKPAGDQPGAIRGLLKSFESGNRHQTLLGVTGSGKTFTVANVIEKIGKPTLVIAHNKTLAAQLAEEYREFFPENAVHYFVSYYDYYQPEAYMPITDTYIEKEAQINKEIELLRHASTQALLTGTDVIIVASVSCIYGLGSPEEYEKVNMKIEKAQKISRGDFLRKLVSIYFERTNSDLEPGKFRSIGNSVEIMPVNEKIVYRIDMDGDSVSKIQKIDGVTQAVIDEIDSFFLFPAKHFVTPEKDRQRAIEDISLELEERLKELESSGKILERERLKRRTQYDIALIREIGYCNGIENYSRHFSGKAKGEPPDTLLSYFPHKADGTPDFLTVIDESHVTIPQLRGMYAGDASRKDALVEHGFRLPSAKDNRPLRFDEFNERVGQILYTSATPGSYELGESVEGGIVEQVIRPTGLIDPEVIVKPIQERKNENKSQVYDFIDETLGVVDRGGRVLATTLTKRMAEDLSIFLKEKGIKAEYLHSEVMTIDRIEIITDFRKGKFDVLVGVNLLREGLDMPEVELIGILDADKEGFLRSETSLIQTIGRAARNINGKVILYADKITGSIERAINETNRRRKIQIEYNKKHEITPQTIKKQIKDIREQMFSKHEKALDSVIGIDMASFMENPKKFIKAKEKQMSDVVKVLDFETAALIRDEIIELKKILEKKTTTQK